MSFDSPGYTVITNRVNPDRVISKFPQSFHADASPYTKSNFHARVKVACAEQRAVTVGLKICKAVLVGDVAVGKTSIVNRFCHNTFDRDYKTTIGVDFEVEKFGVLSTPLTVQLWDTAGQERFKCIAASYYRGSNIVIVVFDLTDLTSLKHARQWMEDASATANEPTKFLVGSKLDLLSDLAYKDIEKQAIEIANEIGAEYWAVSSKTGHNVKDFFFRMVALTFDELVLRELDHKSPVVKTIGNKLINIDDDSIYEKEQKKRANNCC